MRIDNLKEGTQLMWDSKSNNPITGKPIIYPATVGIRHPEYNDSRGDRKWVKIHTPNNKQWMGPEEEHLRYPTEEELIKYNKLWPKV